MTSSSPVPSTATTATSWEAALSSFSAHLAAEGRRQSTVRSHLSHLRSLEDLVGGRPSDATPTDITEWLSCSGGSERIRRTIAHTFFSWAAAAGLIATSPAPVPAGRGPVTAGASDRCLQEVTALRGGQEWHRWIQDFGSWQRAANHSPGTIRLYAYRLADLAALAPEGPASVTTELLLSVLGNSSWRAGTKKSVRSVMRSFYRWAQTSGRMEGNPAASLPAVIVPAHMPRPTPQPVLDAALREAAPREEFMILLGSVGGLRCSEISRLHETHWDGSSLTVYGKGGKTRLVPIRHERLVELLDRVEGFAFPNRWTGRPMTPGHVTKLLSAALAETWTGHTLRHHMATKGLRGTKNLHAVARVLGHARLETTQMYTLLDDEDAIAVAIAVAGESRASTTNLVEEAAVSQNAGQPAGRSVAS